MGMMFCTRCNLEHLSVTLIKPPILDYDLLLPLILVVYLPLMEYLLMVYKDSKHGTNISISTTVSFFYISANGLFSGSSRDDWRV